jgi:AraC-like DNA-binding protein/quercetin dioxygenase-like cupin family protein
MGGTGKLTIFAVTEPDPGGMPIGRTFRPSCCSVQHGTRARVLDPVMLRAENSWVYSRERSTGAVEYGRWDGDAAPALGMHFHDEDQLTMVLSGSRAFQLKSQAVYVLPGECLYIPAGWPHRSLRHGGATRCINAYVGKQSGVRVPAMLSTSEVTEYFHNAVPCGKHAAVSSRPQPVGTDVAAVDLLPLTNPRDHDASIGDIASRYGLSREAYTRSFSRRFGMPPHAFRIVSRLNLARRQIRAGETLAAIAVDQGFADQSHFGRHFRRVFGVTPETYREAMR